MLKRIKNFFERKHVVRTVEVGDFKFEAYYTGSKKNKHDTDLYLKGYLNNKEIMKNNLGNGIGSRFFDAVADKENNTVILNYTHAQLADFMESQYTGSAYSYVRHHLTEFEASTGKKITDDDFFTSKQHEQADGNVIEAYLEYKDEKKKAQVIKTSLDTHSKDMSVEKVENTTELENEDNLELENDNLSRRR